MISKKAELPYVDQPLMGSKIHTVLKVLDDLILSFFLRGETVWKQWLSEYLLLLAP